MRWTPTLTAALAALSLVACSDEAPRTSEDVGSDVAPDADPDPCAAGSCAPSEARLGEPVPIVPGAGLPTQVTVQTANNNLDVIRHGDAIFLAFRTGPSHFASADVQMHVVSSSDLDTWSFEATFDFDTDLREPRFLSFNDRLFFYFALLGDEPTDFEPGGTRVSERLGPGQWTEPAPIFEEGFIPWRIHVYDGVPYLLGYVGGENIYDPGGEPVEVSWLTTRDGLEWEPVVAGQPVVLVGGSSETDFVFQGDGGVLAVSRNELGDELGFGSKICRAEPETLGDWRCVADPRKYDSPLLFRHGSEIFLIGRRNLSDDGFYDLGFDHLNGQSQLIQYQLDYWGRPKRCSLWRVDPESLEVAWVVDLPSRGDTCFASLLDDGEGGYTVFNYTSPLDGPDVSWQRGQRGDTLIYRIALGFERPEP